MEQPDIDDHLSRDARERLQQTLAPGETLLWAAVPIPRLHLRRHGSDLFSGLLCLALAFACAGKAGLFSAEETRMTLSGGIFISIVLTFILLPCLSYLSRPWIEYWRRRNMIAAVTDRRCLLLYPRLFRRPGLCEWPLCYHSVDEQPDGSGDIIFITPAHTRRPGTIGPTSFPDIPCVRRVQHIIDNAARAAAPSPEPDDDSDAPGLSAPTPWRHLIAGTIALLIAAGVSIIVYLTARSSYRIVRDYSPATATVTHVEWIERESGRGGSRVARVLYRFTLDGQSYTGRKEGATIGVEEVGERIDILYNPDNPAENSSSGFFALWFIPVFFGGFLLLTASLSTYSFITLFKELRKAPRD